MITRFLPYVNAVTQRFPNYGKMNALGFVLPLLCESYMKLQAGASSLFWIAFAKSIPACGLLNAAPAFEAPRIYYPTSIAFTTLSSRAFLLKFLDVVGTDQVKKGKKEINAVFLDTDRPPLVSFLTCASEVVNVASKVINSLATGVVVQKMFTGQTEGKVRTITTAILLSLSVLNVFLTVEEN
ncbi:MAG: hypothetical protein ACRDFB_00910 [Rhabdochlamydiaceae bacterium]